MTIEEHLKQLHFDTENERLFLIAKIAMARYAREKCAEQREIIYNYQLNKHGAVMVDVKDSIFNSPDPEFN